MKNRAWQITFILLGSLSIGVGLGQGCSRPFSTSTSSGLNNNEPMPLSMDENGYQIDPNAPTLSMVYNKQVLDHLTSCSGIGIPSDATLATWSSKRGAVSLDGTVLTITAPMLMAITTISGDVCRDLVNKEKSSPRLFNYVNWAATSLPADSVLRDSVRALALSCWQRPEEDIEQDLIIETLKSQFSSGAIDMGDAYLFMCTSVLSALDTLTL